ncbi:MAG: LemA family protein [Bacteroidales bacterium]|jgi:LemA protein|nr:LemA family protein [Bacteroidales bacterium]
MGIIIAIIVVALLVLWVISVQRKLVNQDELCKNSMSTIGVQQESRWDALTGMVELVKSYNEHEYNTLRDVIAQRRPIDGNSTAEEADLQENLMGQVASRLNVVIEQYPDLKANENYSKAMDAVDKYTNMVRTSKMVYNDTATNYNKLIRQIPDSFVASIFGFKVREYLKIEDQKTGMPSLKI